VSVDFVKHSVIARSKANLARSFRVSHFDSERRTHTVVPSVRQGQFAQSMQLGAECRIFGCQVAITFSSRKIARLDRAAGTTKCIAGSNCVRGERTAFATEHVELREDFFVPSGVIAAER